MGFGSFESSSTCLAGAAAMESIGEGLRLFLGLIPDEPA
jgi:hypothetical protein